MSDVVIVEAVRSPLGKRKGGLSGTHSTELLAKLLAEQKLSLYSADSYESVN